MKILFVIGSLELGGAESQMMMLIEGLKQKNYDCEVFSLNARGYFLKKLENLNVPVHDGGFCSEVSRPKKIILLTLALFKLWRLSLSFNILHSYLPLANFLCAIACVFNRNVTLYISKRALGTHQERRRYWRYLDIYSNLVSDGIVCNSRAVVDDCIRRESPDLRKIKRIYNGINFSKFSKINYGLGGSKLKDLGVPSDSIVFITVANLIGYKGYDDALTAFSLVAGNYSNAIYLVVGEDRGIGLQLIEKSISLGVGQKVYWLGRRSDVSELLCASDIYLSASHEEGFSNSILEAMCAGKAIIATNVGGTAEMLDFGSCGILVDKGSHEQMAEAMAWFLNDIKRVETYGKKAYDFACSNFSPETMIREHISLYNNNNDGL